jgi:Ala-tRNA(Pro) deacylase
MIDSNLIFKKIISILDEISADYKLFSHKPAFTYKELLEAQKQAGFFGTEMKCLVLKSEKSFLVYITIQGNKLNFEKIKDFLEINELRLATPKELRKDFGAEPGCAYLFGFNKEIPIFIDPIIYKQDWLLFSPILPDKTVQVKAADLKKVFDVLDNEIKEIDFNQ